MSRTSASRTTQVMSRGFEWPSGPLVDEIAGVLRERIIEGRYAARAPLSQRALARELTVARGVVGEALRMLHREGLVDIAQIGARTRVAAVDRWVLLSACAVREVIDGLAARLAAGHAGPAIRAKCRAALGEQRVAVRCGDRQRYLRANVAFHAAVIDGSANPLLRSHLWLVRSTSRGAVLLGPPRMREEIREHEAILAAVSRGEPEQAELAARAHVRATIAALEQIRDGR
jgi:DNA-binding GntR family transcriptional regulator